MKEDHNSKPAFWPCFSLILNFFKLFGVLPVSINLPRYPKIEIEIQCSKLGSTMSVLFLLMTVFHAIWGPQMHRDLEKAMANTTTGEEHGSRGHGAIHGHSHHESEHRHVGHHVVEHHSSEGDKSGHGTHRDHYVIVETAHMKIAHFTKIMYPLMGSFTSLSARILSLFVLVKALPVLLSVIGRADFILSLPSMYHLTDFKSLTALTVLGIIFHVPVIFLHIRYVGDFINFSGKIWQIFSLINVFTTFFIELQFVLICWSIRSRFLYVNNLLKTFISQEFCFDKKGRELKSGDSQSWKHQIKQQNRKIFQSESEDKNNMFTLFWKLEHTTLPRQTCLNLFRQNWLKSSDESLASLLKSIRRGHILLYDAMERTNDVYQVYLLVTILSSIAKILLNCYFVLFGHMTAPNEASLKNGMPLIILWCIYYCLRFFVLVNSAHFTVTSSKQARSILSKIDWKDLEILCRQEIKMFAHHLSGRNFEFSACGLFNLNSSLISTTFSTAVTYLVIMAQLH